MASVSTIRVRQTGGRPQTAELVIEEAEVEAGIVRDQRAIAEEFEQILDLVGESGLVGEEAVGQAVHRLAPRSASAGRD